MAIYRKGADPTALRAAAVRMDGYAREFATVRTAVDGVFRGLPNGWAGGDLRRFADGWRGAGANVDALERTLRSLGEAMRRNAAAQDVASTASAPGWTGQGPAGPADPGSPVGPPPPPPPPPATPAPVDGYGVGSPQKPQIPHDEDFVYGSASAGPGDYLAAVKWKAKLLGGRAIRSDLDDATAMYAHYWDNNGEPQRFDYEEGYREDQSIKVNVDSEIARTAAAVDTLAAGGQTSFSVTGQAHPATAYPNTENWQKTIGAYHQWSSADVTVKDGIVTMKVTVHAEDYYNFNRNQSDIATGAGDNENGRFTEIGWAKPFPTSGEVTREISWPVGSPPPSIDAPAGDEARNPGREDRADERGNPRPGIRPDNDRSTGPVTLP